MDTTGRPSYIFQFICAPGTSVEQNLMTQPTSAEPRQRRGADPHSRARVAAPKHHSEGLADPAGHVGELHAPRLQERRHQLMSAELGDVQSQLDVIMEGIMSTDHIPKGLSTPSHLSPATFNQSWPRTLDCSRFESTAHQCWQSLLNSQVPAASHILKGSWKKQLCPFLAQLVCRSCAA